MADDAGGRRGAERRIGWAKLMARAKQILTTDPTGTDADDDVVADAGAAALAREAARHRGGLAKVAQRRAYQAGADADVGRAGREQLATLWDQVPPISAAATSAVVAAELGRAPGALFATWEATPIAAASLGQVHAATDGDGARWAVKVQYPAVADALRAELASTSFVRTLAGAELGGHLDDAALATVRTAITAELDYREEAEGLRRFATAWADDPVIRIPAVDLARSSARVLTMARAPGTPLARWRGSTEATAVVATAIARFAWGSPLAHGILNIDPHPGNFLVEDAALGPRLWCLDFGGHLALPDEVVAADREIWWGLVDDDVFRGAERFRLGLARVGLLARTDRLATSAHRAWEQLLAAPLAPGGMAWTPAYAEALAAQFAEVMAAGAVSVPASVVMLWRQRLGVAAVLGRLGATVDGRAVVVGLIGRGLGALR
ncbi:MAG: AarF/UbiB family protein [Kofleriaceae bacterium]